ncbi:MAG TPA: DJ-1/PfpI family protein [Croceibacterium sp.]
MRILIPVYQKFDLLDVCGPSEMFNWAGYTVDLVAEVPGQVISNNGFVFEVPNGLPAQGTPYDALWIPGGSPDQLTRIIDDPQQRYLGFLQKQAAQSTWVCSVCEGALLAAAAGLLDGYTATTHWAFIPYLMQNNPKVTVADGHPRFVVDRNRLTGGGISSGLDESLQLITLLSGDLAAQQVQQTTQYYPDPPVSSQIPNVITTPMMPAPK